MTDLQDSGSYLAVIAVSARRRRDLFVAREALLAELLDRPVGAEAAVHQAVQGHGHQGGFRAVISSAAVLQVGTGLEDAFCHDWFPAEEWGAWSAAERAVLPLLISPAVMRPVRLRMVFRALIIDHQVRRATISASGRVLATVEFSTSETEVTVEAPIAEEDINRRFELNLVVEVDGLVSPLAAIGAPDNRLLGIGLSRLVAVGGEFQGVRRIVAGAQIKRVVRVLRRARQRLSEMGLARGSLHLLSAAARRIS